MAKQKGESWVSFMTRVGGGGKDAARQAREQERAIARFHERQKMAKRKRRRGAGLSGGNPASIRQALKETCGITISHGDCGPGGALVTGWRIKQSGRQIGCEGYLDEAIDTARRKCPRVGLYRTRY